MFLDIGDAELIYLIRSNNYMAREVLFNRYKKRIYGMISSLANKGVIGKDYEEYYQDCFVVFLKCIENFDEEYNFFYYVKSSINRKLRLLSEQESINKEILSLDYVIDEDNNILLDTIADPSQNYDQSDLDIYIDENFDDIEKDFITLRLKGYSISEIAKIKNISKKKVCKILQGIKNTLLLNK